MEINEIHKPKEILQQVVKNDTHPLAIKAFENLLRLKNYSQNALSGTGFFAMQLFIKSIKIQDICAP